MAMSAMIFPVSSNNNPLCRTIRLSTVQHRRIQPWHLCLGTVGEGPCCVSKEGVV